MTSSLHVRNATPAEEALLGMLDPARLPRHVAVIMDGNRRWAREHLLPAIMGHRAGVRAFRELVRACSDLGIGVVTAYAFSLENWKRSPQEIGILMHLFEHYSRKDRAEMLSNGVKFRVIGDLAVLPDRVRREFARTTDATSGNQRTILNLAVNYGARHEILRAVRELSRALAEGRLRDDEVDEEALSAHLYTAGLPDPDLLIRTSGEMRVSNFLLWQVAYTEFWFTARNWPDFSRTDFLQALVDYQARDRRFGGGAGVPGGGRSGGRLGCDAGKEVHP